MITLKQVLLARPTTCEHKGSEQGKESRPHHPRDVEPRRQNKNNEKTASSAKRTPRWCDTDSLIADNQLLMVYSERRQKNAIFPFLSAFRKKACECSLSHNFADWVGEPERMLIGGVDVEFPFKPYPCQVVVASHLIRALSKRENALLESPTGSGKTLALLCAALAFQQKLRQQASATPLLPVELDGPAAGLMSSLSSSAAGASSSSATASRPRSKWVPIVVDKSDSGTAAMAAPLNPDLARTDGGTCPPPPAPPQRGKVPKIYYCSRTHAQLAQVRCWSARV